MEKRIQIGIRVEPDLYLKIKEYMRTENIDTMAAAVKRILTRALS